MSARTEMSKFASYVHLQTDEPIRFEGRKVRAQCHNETKYCPKSLVQKCTFLAVYSLLSKII